MSRKVKPTLIKKDGKISRVWRSIKENTGNIVKACGVLLISLGLVAAGAGCNAKTDEQTTVATPPATGNVAETTLGPLEGYIEQSENIVLPPEKRAGVDEALDSVLKGAEITFATLVQRKSKDADISMVVGVQSGERKALVSAKTDLEGDISAEDFVVDLDTIADSLITAFESGELRSVETDAEYVAPESARTRVIDAEIVGYTNGKAAMVDLSLKPEYTEALQIEVGKMLGQEGKCELEDIYFDAESKTILIEGFNEQGGIRRVFSLTDANAALLVELQADDDLGGMKNAAKAFDMVREIAAASQNPEEVATTGISAEEMARHPGGTALFNDIADVVNGKPLVIFVNIEQTQTLPPPTAPVQG